MRTTSWLHFFVLTLCLLGQTVSLEVPSLSESALTDLTRAESESVSSMEERAAPEASPSISISKAGAVLGAKHLVQRHFIFMATIVPDPVQERRSVLPLDSLSQDCLGSRGPPLA